MTRPSGDGGGTGRPCMVLGYDRSEGSRHAARWAANELAAGGRLVIVYACRGQHIPPSPLASADERHQLGSAILDELMLDGDDALFEIELETHVSDQDPASALIAAAQRHDARAIVLGSKPHSRLGEALGTVTTELLRTSPVPVIAVPSSAPAAGRPLFISRADSARSARAAPTDARRGRERPAAGWRS